MIAVVSHLQILGEVYMLMSSRGPCDLFSFDAPRLSGLGAGD
jgi:hypothetical protein